MCPEIMMIRDLTLVLGHFLLFASNVIAGVIEGLILVVIAVVPTRFIIYSQPRLPE